MAAFATAEEWVLHDHTDSNARSPPPTSSLMCSRRVITSVVRLLEIMKDSSWGLLRHFSSNHRTTCCGSFGGGKNQNQRTIKSSYFKNLKELVVFMKEQVNIQWLLRWLIDSFNFLRTMVICQNCFFVLKNL